MRIGIAGAGPSALYLLRMVRNHDVVVYEEDSRLGLPRHCTGLVSMNGATALGIYRRDIVMGRYSRVRVINGEDGSTVTFNLPKHSIIMLDRPSLEESLYDGSGIIFNARVKAVSPHGDINTASRDGRFDAVVVAEGARARLSGIFGIKYDYLFGIQGDGKAVGDALPSSIDEIIVVFDRRISSSYFSWIVPIDGGEYRAGVTDRMERIAGSLAYFRKRFGISYRTMFGGNVMVSSRGGSLIAGRAAAIGDSTGMNKALTGGGILTGVLSARLLGLSLDLANDVDTAFRAYVDAMNTTVGTALRFYSYLSSLLYLRSGIQPILDLLDEVNGLSISVDDYDNHAKAIASVLRSRPSLLFALLRIVINMDLGSPINAAELLLGRRAT